MDMTTRVPRRAAAFRRIGWLAVAAMTTLALVGPAAGPAGAAAVKPAAAVAFAPAAAGDEACNNCPQWRPQPGLMSG